MQSKYMDFEFGKIHYQISDFTKINTLILLHAFHSSSVSYTKVCELLSDQFNLICMDFPGHGKSDRINTKLHGWYYSVEGFSSLVIDFVNRLELKNYFIVGDSIGGNSAVRVMPSLKSLNGLTRILHKL